MMMNQRLKACPYCHCEKITKKGFYYVKVLKIYRRRFSCQKCRKNFSNQTLHKTYKQKRPDLNQKISSLLTNGVTQRGCARILKCSKTTVENKFRWLTKHLGQFKVKSPTEIIYIDEMETIEHTKLKPLTLPLAVSDSYEILSTTVARIPAKGHLAKFSRRKYGHRPDERKQAIEQLLLDLKRSLPDSPRIIKTDESSIYKKLIQKIFPNAQHETYSSRSLIEKKREMVFLNQNKKVFDPLFPLNQRCAKLRAEIRRLTRRSWCTTKSITNLSLHLKLYQAMQYT